MSCRDLALAISTLGLKLVRCCGGGEKWRKVAGASCRAYVKTLERRDLPVGELGPACVGFWEFGVWIRVWVLGWSGLVWAGMRGSGLGCVGLGWDAWVGMHGSGLEWSDLHRRAPVKAAESQRGAGSQGHAPEGSSKALKTVSRGGRERQGERRGNKRRGLRSRRHRLSVGASRQQ